jgi:hypothetical protein
MEAVAQEDRQGDRQPLAVDQQSGDISDLP